MEIPLYSPCDDLWIITTYYNPYRYQSRRYNFDVFTESLRKSGLNWRVVENAFGDQEFELPSGSEIIQVRSPDILWQKERLLNLAIQSLPAHARKVAWVDCDVIFSNSNWAVETSLLLDQFLVVQPFEGRVRLNQQGQPEDEAGNYKPGFVMRWLLNPLSINARDLEMHGSPGYAWAAQRSLLDEHGLYDCWLSGIGDHVMAHAMVGDFDGSCIQSARLARSTIRQERVIQRSILWQKIRTFLPPAIRKFLWKSLQIMPSHVEANYVQWDHFLSWGRPFFASVQGRLAFTPGTVFHLWHGAASDRGYSFSQSEFNRMNFNPSADLQLGTSGCWEWASNKPELHRLAAEFFENRKEDG